MKDDALATATAAINLISTMSTCPPASHRRRLLNKYYATTTPTKWPCGSQMHVHSITGSLNDLNGSLLDLGVRKLWLLAGAPPPLSLTTRRGLREGSGQRWRRPRIAGTVTLREGGQYVVRFQSTPFASNSTRFVQLDHFFQIR